MKFYESLKEAPDGQARQDDQVKRQTIFSLGYHAHSSAC